jgi:hypothetical protein
VEARSVLLVSADTLVAALLGALVELEGYTPVFPRDGESPRAALRRLRPGAGRIDGAFAEGRSAATIGPAKMMGTTVVLFGRSAVAQLVRDCAREFGVALLPIPPSPGDLRRALAPPDD